MDILPGMLPLCYTNPYRTLSEAFFQLLAFEYKPLLLVYSLHETRPQGCCEGCMMFHVHVYALYEIGPLPAATFTFPRQLVHVDVFLTNLTVVSTLSISQPMSS